METAADLWAAAYQALQGPLGLGAAPDAPGPAAGGLAAYQALATAAGPACLEVHQAAETAPAEIWVCVPRPGLPGIAASEGYNWFRYRRDPASGRIVPWGGPGLIMPPYGPWPTDGPTSPPQPVLVDDGDWAHRTRYLIKQVVFPGADPPHWSPMLVLTDVAQPFIGRIHALMQDPATRNAALGLIDQARPPQDVSLTQRVMNNWQPVTVRGLAMRSSFTENDFALDHAVAYNRPASNGAGLETPSGTLWEGNATDPDWPGLDWHIDVRPDPDVRYLASPGQPERVAVEIEHFTLPVEYRPQLGEWLQVAGRWIIDAGHIEAGMGADDGFHTEIHPEELIVASRPDVSHALGTLARVTTTGAWQGLPLSFVVYPPPRPTPAAQLRWAVSDEWRQRATLTLTAWPANANHLVGTLETDDPTPLLIHPNGMVGMTDTRGYHALITCWWDVPAAQVAGQLLAAGAPAVGSVVCYAPAGAAPATWQQVAVDGAGAYTIPALPPGPYLFRPAGSAWDFAAVPHRVDLAPGAQAQDFAATPAAALAACPAGDLSAYPLHRAESLDWSVLLRRDALTAFGPNNPASFATWTFDGSILQGLGAATRDLAPIDDALLPLLLSPRLGLDLTAQQAAGPAPDAADPAVASALADALLTLRAPAGPLGVQANGLGYVEGGRWLVNLARLDDGQGQPIAAVAQAVARVRLEEVDNNGHPWIIQDVVQIQGLRGPGVSGATVQACLWMVDATGTPRRVATATGDTDVNGTVRFDLGAGTHPGSAVLTVAVLSNPGNPWLLPRTQLAPALFYPAATGDDAAPAQPYTLTAAAPPADRDLGPAGAEEIQLQRSVDRRLETQAAVRDLGPAAGADDTRGLGPAPQAVAPPPPGPPGDPAQLEQVTRSTVPRPDFA